MNRYCNEKLSQLDENLSEISSEQIDAIAISEVAIRIILKTLSDIKQFVLEKNFSNEEEEIQFFKELKPRIVAKLIYYNAIFKIETKKPYGGEKKVKKYLNNELNKLKRFFDNNLDFYRYYRTNSTYLDHRYFVRGRYDIKLTLDTFYFEVDHNFSTSHDYKVAKIIANDLIQVYIEDQLYNKYQENKQIATKILTWSNSKTALTELIYALYSHGALGNADIITIAKTFETVFNIDLGDFYHTFMELKSRKINRTKFLDNLRDDLIKKMDEQDEV